MCRRDMQQIGADIAANTMPAIGQCISSGRMNMNPGMRAAVTAVSTIIRAMTMSTSVTMTTTMTMPMNAAVASIMTSTDVGLATRVEAWRRSVLALAIAITLSLASEPRSHA